MSETALQEFTVYPRGCGGAIQLRCGASSSGGLSPRVRGSQHAAGGRNVRDGSIPAGAGEPALNNGLTGFGRVYPRGCGGATVSSPDSATGMGLSPRMRGSQR